MHCGGSDMLFLRQFSKAEMFVIKSQNWHRLTHTCTVYALQKQKADVAIDDLP